MKKDEAKEQIRLLWMKTVQSTRIKHNPMLFYQWLKREHPEVLKFRASKYKRDKYEVISAWVNCFKNKYNNTV